MAIGGRLEVRSNWQIYVQEFAQALALTGRSTKVSLYQAEQSITPFERKYWASGQQSYRLVIDL